jgi:hypothetical protein
MMVITAPSDPPTAEPMIISLFEDGSAPTQIYCPQMQSPTDESGSKFHLFQLI